MGTSEAAISVLVDKARAGGVRSATDQQIVDAMVSVCEYFDRDGSYFSFFTDVFFMFDEDWTGSPGDDPIYSVFAELLVDFKDADEPEAHTDVATNLARGAVVLFCPEHESALSTR